MTVYELKVDWATNDDYGCTTTLYSTYSKAKKAMNFEVLQAMEDYGVFNEITGELENDSYELEVYDDHWELYEDGYYLYNHCLIEITEKEIL